MGDSLRFIGKCFIHPYSNYFKSWKYMFVRVIWRDGTSMVTTWEDEIYYFPLYWTEDLMVINIFDFEYLTITEREMANVLEDFNITIFMERMELNR